jgi:hypothetical protein
MKLTLKDWTDIDERKFQRKKWKLRKSMLSQENDDINPITDRTNTRPIPGNVLMEKLTWN